MWNCKTKKRNTNIGCDKSYRGTYMFVGKCGCVLVFIEGRGWVKREREEKKRVKRDNKMVKNVVGMCAVSEKEKSSHNNIKDWSLIGGKKWEKK